MSSPPVSPYKSRVLNAINRTFLTWNDHSKTSFNKLKIIAKWGVQILLYPLYLGIQTARMAVKQLLNPASNTDSSIKNKSLINGTIEQPIEKILAGIKPQLSTTIKSIATELENKNLVLITQENKLLHLTNKSQEKQLENWIKWELANYYYQQKALILNKNSRYLVPIKTNNPQVIFPVNIFWKIMAWIEKSPVATTLNLFGEIRLISDQKDYDQDQLSTSLNVLENKIKSEFDPQQIKENKEINLILSPPIFLDFLTEIDQKIAILETNEKLTNIVNIAQKLPQKIKDQFLSLNFKTDPNNPFTIQAIIIAAINYFFRQSHQNQKFSSNYNNSSINNLLEQLDQREILTLEGDNNHQQKTLNSVTIGENIKDPWLTSPDIFTTVNNKMEESNHTQFPPYNYQLNGFHLIPEKPKSSPFEKLKQLWNIQSKNQDSQSLILRELKDNSPQILTDHGLKPTTPIQPEEIFTTSEIIPNNQQEKDDNYIETPATHLGYEKHFLEHLLGWLDGIMVLIEELFIDILKWLKRKI